MDGLADIHYPELLHVVKRRAAKAFLIRFGVRLGIIPMFPRVL